MNVVADEDAGNILLPSAADEADDFVGLLDRQMVGRLVEDQHLGLEMHGARDRDALPLAAGQFADKGVGERR